MMVDGIPAADMIRKLERCLDLGVGPVGKGMTTYSSVLHWVIP